MSTRPACQQPGCFRSEQSRLVRNSVVKFKRPLCCNVTLAAVATRKQKISKELGRRNSGNVTLAA